MLTTLVATLNFTLRTREAELLHAITPPRRLKPLSTCSKQLSNAATKNLPSRLSTNWIHRPKCRPAHQNRPILPQRIFWRRWIWGKIGGENRRIWAKSTCRSKKNLMTKLRSQRCRPLICGCVFLTGAVSPTLNFKQYISNTALSWWWANGIWLLWLQAVWITRRRGTRRCR